jgi:hypothetical protein
MVHFGIHWTPEDLFSVSMIDHYDRSLLGRTRTRHDGELAVKVQKSHFADDEIVNGDATSIASVERKN